MENNINNNIIDERRRYRRAESSLSIQYRNLRKPGDVPIQTLTKNISEGGVSFKSSEFISLACRLVVEISLPILPKPIKAISKIAWIRKIPSSDQYELGNQFLEITKEDKAHLINFVNKLFDTSL